MGHLLDAGAVAELMWEHFLAPITRRRLDSASGGHGRDLLVLSCALHDLGKATPAFQVKVPELWGRVVAAGLGGVPDGRARETRTHWRAGAFLLKAWLRDADAEGLAWLAAVIEGHHGKHEERLLWQRRSALGDGDASWRSVQFAVADHVAGAFGIVPTSLVGPPPSRADQLALAGYVVMADWIASSSLFPGLGDEVADVERARARARAAWSALGFQPGWRSERLDARDPLRRFALVSPRPIQQLCVGVASGAVAPGLSIVEAPMGEGKTEAGLAMAEVLAERFGCNGVVFAMPTQGTTDAMYERVCAWAHEVDPGVPVSLLHGKAMLNEAWRERQACRDEPMGDVLDAYGLPEVYGEQGEPTMREPAVPDWMLGRHRGLLSHLVVGTIDQVLFAATRTKFVSLRHAGLAGKVLIIDEVHSYDVYMSVFLDDLLRWCAEGGVPVVLMSATLAPALRHRLVQAYRGGLGAGHPLTAQLDAATDYPRITTVSTDGVEVVGERPFRADLHVEVELAGGDPEDLTHVAERIRVETDGGGCVLAVLNTVARAQELFRLVQGEGIETTLLHGRLTTASRASRTAELVDRLGAGRTRATGRPRRHVIVSTQIAEQSFDVDADLLITDIAPMDLLLQRVGRLHRHERGVEDRPSAMRDPRVWVLGVRTTRGAPELARGPLAVYGPRALLRSVEDLAGGASWGVPSQVPALVAHAYRDAPLSAAWRVAFRERLDAEEAEAHTRSERAKTFVLSSDRAGLGDLAGLHYSSVTRSDDEARTVRDGEPTREVALVIRGATGYRSLDGRDLGANGERCSALALARLVWGDTVRLREGPADAWVRELRPLPGWSDLPLVGRLPVLELDEDGRALGHPGVSYDQELGLLIDRFDGR